MTGSFSDFEQYAANGISLEFLKKLQNSCVVNSGISKIDTEKAAEAVVTTEVVRDRQIVAYED